MGTINDKKEKRKFRKRERNIIMKFPTNNKEEK